MLFLLFVFVILADYFGEFASDDDQNSMTTAVEPLRAFMALCDAVTVVAVIVRVNGRAPPLYS